MRVSHSPFRRLLGLAARLVAAVFCLSPVLGAAPDVEAATITVNTYSDGPASPTKCRLRDAIIAANTNATPAGTNCAAGTLGLDTITFHVTEFCAISGCVIGLTSALPTVTQDLTIVGNSVAISGNHAYRVFDLGNAVVNLSNLKVVNGAASSGGIRASVTALTLNNVVVSGNSGPGLSQTFGSLAIYNSSFVANQPGGAIFVSGAFGVISNTVFLSNTASSGAALFATDFANVSVSGSVFEGNGAAKFGGGALYLQTLAQVTIDHSAFTNNHSVTTTVNYASQSLGGGAIEQTSGVLTISNTTFANNDSSTVGGMFLFEQGQASLTNVTISGNTARASGGGIFVRDIVGQQVNLTLNNVTLSSNTADVDNTGDGNGGGIAVLTGTVQVYNSILAGNFDTPDNAGPGAKHPDCSGSLASARFTLVGRNDGCSGIVDGVDGDEVGTAANPLAPQLGPLADNGGPTQTRALLVDSPALRGGDPAVPGSTPQTCAVNDQRGVLRPLGLCDMGAFQASRYLLYLPALQR